MVLLCSDLPGNILCSSSGADEPACGVHAFPIALSGLCSVSGSAAVPNLHFFHLNASLSC